MHSFIHSFIRPKRKRGGHAETVYSRPRRGAKFFALTSVILPPPLPPCHVIVSFLSPPLLSLNTPVIAWARRIFVSCIFQQKGIRNREEEERDEGRLICRGVYRVISSCLANAGERSTRPKPRRERFNFTDQKFEQFGGRPKRISRGVAAACFAGDT